MSFGFNPLVAQGNLNRVSAHVTVAGNNSLNVTASNMTKSLLSITLEEPFVDQEPTATGIVNSPRPFVMGTITMNLLRSQSLANSWIALAALNAVLGTVTVYPDSNVFTPLTFTNTSITGFDPGTYDGLDPTVKITMKGTFYINAVLWAGNTQATTIGT